MAKTNIEVMKKVLIFVEMTATIQVLVLVEWWKQKVYSSTRCTVEIIVEILSGHRWPEK